MKFTKAMAGKVLEQDPQAIEKILAGTHVIVGDRDGETGIDSIRIIPKEELTSDVGIAVCGKASSMEYAVKDFEIIPCDRCGVKVVLSPQTPRTMKKYCPDCAEKAIEEELKQDSFGE